MKKVIVIFSLLTLASTTYAKSFACGGDRDFENVKSSVSLELGEPNENVIQKTLLGDPHNESIPYITVEMGMMGSHEVLTISVTRFMEDGTQDIKRATGSTKGIVQFQDESAGGSLVYCMPQ